MANEDIYGYEVDNSGKKIKGKVARPSQIKLLKVKPTVIKLRKVKNNVISTGISL
mgnify:CR=1 FL=1